MINFSWEAKHCLQAWNWKKIVICYDLSVPKKGRIHNIGPNRAFKLKISSILRKLFRQWNFCPQKQRMLFILPFLNWSRQKFQEKVYLFLYYRNIIAISCENSKFGLISKLNCVKYSYVCNILMVCALSFVHTNYFLAAQVSTDKNFPRLAIGRKKKSYIDVVIPSATQKQHQNIPTAHLRWSCGFLRVVCCPFWYF